MISHSEIVFLDQLGEKPKLRSPAIPHSWTEYVQTQESEIVERLKDATIAIINRVPLRQDQLAQLPDLKLIVVRATGYDCVDIDYCRKQGITVSNARSWCTSSVAEHVFTLILALRRQLFAATDLIKKGQWKNSSANNMDCPLPYDLNKSTLGILGYGNLGKRVAELGRAFGMQVLIAARKGSNEITTGRTRFEDVIAKSDVLSLHCPLKENTINLIGATELKSMRQNAILVNCARGGIVDESALAEALKSGVIAGAALDVFQQEPIQNDNPLLRLNLPNLIMTPHKAWLSTDAIASLNEQVISNIENFVSGTPSNVVT